MDTSVVLIIAIAVVIAGVVVFMLRRSWGNFSEAPLAPPPAWPQTTLDSDDEIRQLVAAGKKIEAIKRVRELTGLGLKEAKDFVEALPAASPFAAMEGAQPISAGDVADDPEVRQLVAAGNKIAAIKRVRELTGLGLKEAKDFVEALPAAQPITPTVVAHAMPQEEVANDPEVHRLLAAGKKIEAIKRVRELTGLGLKEAKDFVDSL